MSTSIIWYLVVLQIERYICLFVCLVGLFIYSFIYPTSISNHNHCIIEIVYAIRFIALICIDNLICTFTGGDEEDFDENEMDENGMNEGPERSFQTLFNNVPSILLLSAQSNNSHPRIVYASISALVSYFNPDYCAEEYCDAYGADILTFCLGCYQNIEVPLFIRAECSSLIGNVSLLYSENMNIDQYNVIMNSFQRVIFTPMEAVSDVVQSMITTQRSDGQGQGQGQAQGQQNDNEEFSVMKHELALFRGKSLEGAALLGKAMGKEIFLPTALLFLNLFRDNYLQVKLILF